MPEGATTGKLYAMAILTGIGFTMSLFIGTLAFRPRSYLAQVRARRSRCLLLSGIVAALMILGDRSDRVGLTFLTRRRPAKRRRSPGAQTPHTRHEIEPA